MNTPSDSSDQRAEASTSRSARGRRPQSSKLQAAKDAMYREHIMEVAEGLFAENSFAGTKMQDIARAAGISLGTLYQSYAGKRELYRQLLIVRDGQMFDRAMAPGRQVLQQPQSVEQLLWLTEAHIRFLLEHDNYLRIQLQEGYAWYHRAAQPSADEQRMWEQGINVIKQVIDWGIEQGFFVPGDSGGQARLMIAMQQTRLANWVMEDMQEPHDVIIARIQADFVRQFCRPEIASGMLMPDGAGLAEPTLDNIRALDDAAPG